MIIYSIMAADYTLD